MRAVRARVVAARMALEGVSEELRPSLSSVHAKALIEHLKVKNFAMSSDEATDIMAKIHNIPWAAEDGVRVAEALSNANMNEETFSARRKQQDYMGMLSYFTEAEWSILLNPSVSHAAKRETIALAVAQCGGINLTEESLKLMNTLWMLAAFGYLQARSLNEESKNTQLRALKATVKRSVRNVYSKSSLSTYIVVLPADPQEFTSRYPCVSARRYSNIDGDGPVASKLDNEHVDAIDASYSCRFRASRNPASRELEVPGNVANNNLNQLMATFSSSIVQAICNTKTVGSQPERDIPLVFNNAAEQPLIQGLRNAGQVGGNTMPRALADIAPFAKQRGLSENPLIASRHLHPVRRSTTILDSSENAGSAADLLVGLEDSDPAGRSSQDVEPSIVAAVARESPAVQDSPALAPQLPKQENPSSTLLAVSVAEADLALTLPLPKQDPALTLPLPKQNPSLMLLTAVQDKKPALRVAKEKPAPTEKEGEKDEVTVTPIKAKRPMKAKSSGSSKKTPANATPTAAPDLVKPPHWHHEKSRQQLMLRTGFRGRGQNKAVKYGPGTEHPDLESAKRHADAWVESEKKRQQLAISI